MSFMCERSVHFFFVMHSYRESGVNVNFQTDEVAVLLFA